MLERKWWKRINPTRINLQNNHSRFKNILRHNNRLDATVSKHIGEAKKNSISKESNKLAKQLDLTPKEKGIED